MTTDELHRLRVENDQLRRDAATVLRHLDTLRARVAELERALDACEMVMDTAAILGLPQELPEVYRDSWARAHIEARARLATPTPEGT